MKSFVVCGIILLLGVLGPQRGLEGRYEPVWALGLLMLLAFLCQHAVTRLRLPALIGWVIAGLILGPSGLRVVQPDQLVALRLVHAFAALWVGFIVGTSFSWPEEQRSWRVPGTVGLVTLATFLLISGGIGATTQLPGWLAILIGGVACLWGPFTLWNLQRVDEHALLAGILGTGFGLLLLSAILVSLHLGGFLPSPAVALAGRIWLSVVAGALGAEIVWRLRLFAAPDATLLTGSVLGCALAALLLLELQLYALPCGLAAGLVIVWRQRQDRRVQEVVQPLRPVLFMTFFALAGSTVDLGVLWPLSDGFYQILLVQIFVLTFLRGLGPAIWQPFSQPASGKHLGWLLLPKGALLFELVYFPGRSVLDLLRGEPERLLRQVALADILVHTLVFSILAAAVWRLVRYSEPAVPDPVPQSAPAT